MSRVHRGTNDRRRWSLSQTTGEVTAIIGAGITGLTCADVLRAADPGRRILILERESFPGGASRTETFGEFRFDLGGHRFYTRKAAVQSYFEEVLDGELADVPRFSHICLKGRMIDYPPRIGNALGSMGFRKSVKILYDYLRRPIYWRGLRRRRTFEDWALSRFGKTLYKLYFRAYTKKVWGLAASELSLDFARQRIGGLSVPAALVKALWPRRRSVKTLLTHFLYPVDGFGRLPERQVERLGGAADLRLATTVQQIEHDGRSVRAVRYREGDTEEPVAVSEVVSTASIDELLGVLAPPPPAPVLEAVRALRYRALVIVFLALDKPSVTRDTWIYFPDPGITFARFHEPRNWSERMAPPGRTSLVTEIFCQAGDAVYTAPDEELAGAVARDLERLGLVSRREVSGHKVVRLPRAYPIYSLDYRGNLDVVLDYLRRFDNLWSIGRNGRFLYTSSDHYIDMAMKTAENILGAEHDVYAVGLENTYAERGRVRRRR